MLVVQSLIELKGNQQQLWQACS